MAGQANFNNRFTRNVAGKTLKKRRVLTRKEFLQTAKENPRGALETMTGGIEKGIKAGAQRVPKNLASRALKSGTAKDLAINTVGTAASVAGKSVAGPIGSYVGDLAGAKVARKVVNKGYADVSAWKQRKKGATPADVRKAAGKKYKTLNKLDKKRNENTKDVVGWGIGNASADLLQAAGVSIPLQGAAVAMRTTDSVSNAVKDVSKKRKGVKQAAKDSAKEIANENIVKPAKGLKKAGKSAGEFLKNPKKKIKKAIRRGNARERLMARKINNNIRKAEEEAARRGVEFSEVRYRRRRIQHGMSFGECSNIRKRNKRRKRRRLNR